MPDVAVIGGGPAGLIAAEHLAASGVSVTVFEHKRSVGRKFLLAGRGGLNITHAEPLDQLLERYGSRAPQLETAIRSFSPDELRGWCAGHDETAFVGTSQRVFPKSFRATPLLRSWLRRLAELGVQIETGHQWKGWADDGALQLHTPEAGVMQVDPDATLFALGGASWPRVGSDGGWVPAFERAGLNVEPLGPANCGVHVDWSPIVQRDWAGHPIKNAAFSVGEHSVRGDGMVTMSGLEGGPIYGLGPEIRSALRAGQAIVQINTQPDLDERRLIERLSSRRPKASASSWLNSAGVPRLIVALARDATDNKLPTDPVEMARLLQALPIKIRGLAPIDRAISTAGGISFDELTDDWMLKVLPGTFVAGEMVNWEAPTGGYLLQACFSSGIAAAKGILTWCDQAATN